VLVQNTAWVKGCELLSAWERVRWRALARALASRVCWLKSRMRVGLGGAGSASLLLLL